MKISREKSIFIYIWLGLFIGLFAKLFVIDFLQVQGVSMEDNINEGDTVIVNKLCYGLVMPYRARLICKWGKVKRGDVVIYLHDSKIVIKRCIAIAGDALEYSCNMGYTVTVNDEEIKLSQTQYDTLKHFAFVPENTIFAIGDNRAMSLDSRDYGFVDCDYILGRVWGK